jgi:tRNA (cmo5U34)-methyltransferase
MPDNTTPYDSGTYEDEVRRTIPLHAEILSQAITTSLAVWPEPKRWLDTGCGPGRLVAIARGRSPHTDFFLADPSEAMLALARRHNADLPQGRFFLSPSEDLPRVPPFEVITAVQCHHYLLPASRERAVRKCHSLLVSGGALVVFENVRAETERGQELQRLRWAGWLRAQGRSVEAVIAHAAREGTQYFPLRPSEHVALLETVGFTTVETIWRAYGQAGFLAIANK